MRPHSHTTASTAHNAAATGPDLCVVRASRVIAKMQAGGRTATDPSAWRPAAAPWR